MGTTIIMERLLDVQHKEGGLLRIKSGLYHHDGNKSPHFATTAELRQYGRISSCGCLHDDILEHAPEFAQAISLHLSDDNGKPMYAVENGFYFYGGTQWEKRNNAYLANHLRISLAEAEAIPEGLTKNDFERLYVVPNLERWEAEAEAVKAFLSVTAEKE